jgi:hypothetical protein
MLQESTQNQITILEEANAYDVQNLATLKKIIESANIAGIKPEDYIWLNFPELWEYEDVRKEIWNSSNYTKHLIENNSPNDVELTFRFVGAVAVALSIGSAVYNLNKSEKFEIPILDIAAKSSIVLFGASEINRARRRLLSIPKVKQSKQDTINLVAKKTLRHLKLNSSLAITIPQDILTQQIEQLQIKQGE